MDSARDGSTVLRVEHLTMRFGGLVAIDNLSFDVKRGVLCVTAILHHGRVPISGRGLRQVRFLHHQIYNFLPVGRPHKQALSLDVRGEIAQRWQGFVGWIFLGKTFASFQGG